MLMHMLQLEQNILSISKQGLQAAQQFAARPTDTFLSTYPKTGTTWLQQICHQLRTGGHTDFTEISEEGITPWLEVAPSLGINIAAEHTANPRCFKTHQPLSQLSHLDGRFLCVVRDPEATLLSSFRFAVTHQDTDCVDVNQYARQLGWIEGGSGDEGPTFGARIWDFYAEFWKCRNEPNVHIVSYEMMRKDLRSLLPGIAEFLGLEDLKEQHYDTVTELSSFEWMKKNEHLFDDNYFQKRLNPDGDTEEGLHVSASKVGLVVGSHINTTLTEETIEMMAQIWADKMTPITAHATYLEYAAGLEKPKSI